MHEVCFAHAVVCSVDNHYGVLPCRDMDGYNRTNDVSLTFWCMVNDRSLLPQISNHAVISIARRKCTRRVEDVDGRLKFSTTNPISTDIQIHHNNLYTENGTPLRTSRPDFSTAMGATPVAIPSVVVR